jgi:hypothetical protein
MARHVSLREAARALHRLRLREGRPLPALADADALHDHLAAGLGMRGDAVDVEALVTFVGGPRFAEALQVPTPAAFFQARWPAVAAALRALPPIPAGPETCL